MFFSFLNHADSEMGGDILWMAEILRHLEPWLKPLLVGICRGIESFQGLLGGAKWISSVHRGGRLKTVNFKVLR